jgi:hypothetical protein
MACVDQVCAGGGRPVLQREHSDPPLGDRGDHCLNRLAASVEGVAKVAPVRTVAAPIVHPADSAPGSEGESAAASDEVPAGTATWAAMAASRESSPGARHRKRVPATTARERARRRILLGRCGPCSRAHGLPETHQRRKEQGSTVDKIGVKSFCPEFAQGFHVRKQAAREGMPGVLRRAAESRNLRRYGDPLGPTYEQLIAKYGTGEAVIAAAGRTSSFWNSFFLL